MNWQTDYMGIPLKNPLLAGASPLVDDLHKVRELAAAGIGGIVMHSLFEEQINRDESSLVTYLEEGSESFAEARTYFPDPGDFVLGVEEYLQQIRLIKKTVDVPVFASLNATRLGFWIDQARRMQDAGADGLELNLYFLAVNGDESAADIERRTVEVVEAVCAELTIPVAVKLSPFFTSPAHLAKRLIGVGAKGLVLFNRFYQPDLNIEDLEIEPRLVLSDSSELLLRLRWLAILRGQIQGHLACSGGVHTATDLIKAIMAGAQVVQMTSALLKRGPSCVTTILTDVRRWMEDHDYDSFEMMRGCLSLENCPDPAAYERANYVRILQSWRV